jgi:plasmid stability protein
MANLNIKNVPDPLVRRLKAQAARHRRSLNLEVITCLESATHATAVNADDLLAGARRVRRVPSGVRLTDRALARLKAAGRP